MAASEALVVSAPGKVLLAGGYLVLDPAYPGVVVATQARFYSAAREATPGQRPDILVRSPQFIDADWGFYIQLVEPSSDAEASAPAVHLVQTAESFRQAGPNPFVALALLTAHRLALDSLGLPAYRDRVRSGKTELVIVGDNDFYSHRSSPQSTATTPMTQSQSPSEQASPVPAKIPAPTAAELAKLPAFAPLGVSLRDVHKTGLGSSAAMTTSVVGALLARLGLVGTTGALTASDRALVHNTAQLAHCSAQGKIGSGFDVSSATWGSQLFRRFCPDVLAPVLLEKNAVQVEPSSSPQPEQQERGSPSATEPEPVRNPQADTISLPPGLLRDTLSAQNRNWVPPSSTASMGGVGTAVEGLAKLGGTVRETASASTSAPGVDASHLEEKVAHQPALTQLPPRIELVLADVDAGSNTPSLVSRVLAWRKAQPAWAAQIYTVLNASNQSLADTLLALTLEALKDQGRYDRALDLLAEIKSSEWDELVRTTKEPDHPSHGVGSIVELMIALRNVLRSLRAGMRELGKRADAPIEPDEMGNLIRHSVDAAPGIVGGGVPGAGGYDALYLLYVAPRKDPIRSTGDRTRDAIHTFWSNWSADDGLSVGPLLTGADGTEIGKLVAEVDSQGEAFAHGQLHPDLPNSALFLQSALASSTSGSGARLNKVEQVPGLAAALS